MTGCRLHSPKPALVPLTLNEKTQDVVHPQYELRSQRLAQLLACQVLVMHDAQQGAKLGVLRPFALGTSKTSPVASNTLLCLGVSWYVVIQVFTFHPQ